MADFEFEGQFEGESQYVSESIELNNGNILRATLFLPSGALLPDPGDFSFFLSNDGGSTWESVTRAARHTFSSTGQDLRYKIEGNAGATLKVRQDDGSDKLVKVTWEI